LSGRLLLELAGSAALGAGLLLAWVYALSLLGFSCPSWDPRLSIVPRVLLLPLGYGGALLWALLLLPRAPQQRCSLDGMRATRVCRATSSMLWSAFRARSSSLVWCCACDRSLA